ncbi:MAG: serine/threonine protein kinase [Deltaproteobacteria bacterium]|nr:serine/threonine protein kinase [Deltaproteobacteria bacterium]
MAEVYLARQKGIKGFKRLAVVKRILPHLARERRVVDMFLDEARIAAQLGHPNIVHIYDLGKYKDDYFIAMEYLEGESLGYVVSQARQNRVDLPANLAAGIVREVCNGLDYAHKFRDERGRPLNIVHRDVSPHNIIVLFNGAVKLVDFGVAKAASQIHQTITGALKGKPSYMSPEQLTSKPLDGRSDIFSLGIVFWELLTHRRLYKRDNEAATLYSVINEPVPPIREIKPKVPEELERIVLRAMQKDPDKRYQTAADMALDIKNHLLEARAAADGQEIAVFMEQVLSERARTKKRILDGIKTKGMTSASVGVLKPASEESLPSDSASMETNGKQRPGDAATRLLDDARNVATIIEERNGSAHATAPPRSGLGPLGFSLVVISLLLVIGTSLGWLLQSVRPIEAGSTTVGSGPTGALPPSAQPPGSEPTEPTVEPVAVAGPAPPAKPAPRVEPRKEPTTGRPAAVNGLEKPGKGDRASLEIPSGKRGHASRSRANHGPKPRTGPTRVAASKKPGVLNLNTDPWSEIYLGKRKLGITPLLGLELPPGRYMLRAINRAQGIEKRIQVVIKPLEVTEAFVDLKLDKAGH